MGAVPGGEDPIPEDCDDEDGIKVSCAPLPTSRAVTEMFGDLEDMCFNCNLPQAAVFLRRAMREVEPERAKRAVPGKGRQMLLPELWGCGK